MMKKAGVSRLELTVDLDLPGRQDGDLMLRWSDNENPLGYYPVPIISLKGGSGPTVLIVGGTHGDEFEGPAAIMRLVSCLSPSEMTGQVILIPALNSPAIAVSARVSPLDGANLNRAFPGHADGGPTAMLAHFVETVLMPRCDAVIDLHSGGKASVFEACTLVTQSKDQTLQAKGIALAQAFGLPLLWMLGEANDNRSVNSAAERVGVPMIATELGGNGGVDPRLTDLAETGLRNCLVHLGVIKGELPETPTMRRIAIRSHQYSIFAPSDGLFDRKAEAGQSVEAGQHAGDFCFPLEPTRPPLRLAIPKSGFVLAHCARGMVRRGELLVLVAEEIGGGPPNA